MSPCCSVIWFCYWAPAAQIIVIIETLLPLFLYCYLWMRPCCSFIGVIYGTCYCGNICWPCLSIPQFCLVFACSFFKFSDASQKICAPEAPLHSSLGGFSGLRRSPTALRQGSTGGCSFGVREKGHKFSFCLLDLVCARFHLFYGRSFSLPPI